MRNARSIEIAVGLFVLAGFAALLTLAMRVSDIAAFQTTEGYTVVGYFQNIGGLKEQAPVSLAGVQVGRVTDIELDEETFQARVELTISSAYDNLPMDTSASIRTAGLLGEQYVGLQAGGMPQPLADGDELMLTQSALILEDIISQFIYGQASGDEQ
jgi:phospholipid/cholesterol/gamma-HCH transport system substrate-binding protein